MAQVSAPQPLAMDKPPAPTAVDLEIARHQGGRTVAIDATPSRLKASKEAPPPTLMERVEELTRENGQLRLEIRNHQEMLQPVGTFVSHVKALGKELMSAVVEFEQLQRSLGEQDGRGSSSTVPTSRVDVPQSSSDVTNSWI